LESNVRLFYVYIFFNRLEMWLPTVVLFLLDSGFTLTQYALVDTVWYVATLVFEVPTGVITDRYGKKASMLISSFALSLSLLTLVLGSSFFTVLIAYILWGFASSFESGTYDALIYDSLLQLDREQEYRIVMGRVKTLTILAGGVGSIAAGWLGSVRLDLPLLLTAGVALLLCSFALLFTEPKAPEDRASSGLLHVRDSVAYVHKNRMAAVLIAYSAIVGTVVWGLYIFYQPLFRSLGISVAGTGIIYMLFRLSGATGAYLCDPLFRIVGRASLYLVPICLVACVFGMGFLVSPWVLVLIMPIFFLEGFSYPVINDLLNKNLPPGKRATIISIGSVLACLMGVAAYPALGLIADLFSLQVTFKLLGIGTLVAFIFPLAMLPRELKPNLFRDAWRSLREGVIARRERRLRRWFTRGCDSVQRIVDGLDIGWGGVQRWATAQLPPLDRELHLDLACGYATFMAQLGWRYPNARLIGLNIDFVGPHALARSLLGKAGVPAVLVQADARRMPFANGAFGSASCFLGLQDIEIGFGERGVRQALAEASRVIRSGGVLAVLDEFLFEWFYALLEGLSLDVDDRLERHLEVRWDRTVAERAISLYAEGWVAQARAADQAAQQRICEEVRDGMLKDLEGQLDSRGYYVPFGPVRLVVARIRSAGAVETREDLEEGDQLGAVRLKGNQ
jgi:MFS family permease